MVNRAVREDEVPVRIGTGAGARAKAGAAVRWLAPAVVAALVALPFFAVDVPPVLDYPNHLARLTVLAFGEQVPALAAMYEAAWRIVPNLAIDLIGPPLMQVLPVHVAGRLLLYLAALVPVAGVVLYHRAVFGEPSWWPFGAALAAFNGVFFLGFINFLYGVGLAFAAAALWIALADRKPALAVAGSMAAAAVLFFCHPFGVALFALLVGARELAGLWPVRRDPRTLLRRAAIRGAMLALALAPAIGLYLASPFAEVGTTVAWNFAGKPVTLISPFMGYDRFVSLVSAVVVLSAFVLVLPRRAEADAGSVIAIAVLAAAYAVAPSHLKGGSFVDVRLPLMMALVAFAGFRPHLPRAMTMTLIAVGAVLLVARSVHVTTVWAGHNRDLAGFRAAIAPVEPGARVLLVDGGGHASPDDVAAEPASRRVPGLYRTDLHLAGLLTVERHAFWPLMFADPAQQPIRVRAAYADIAFPLGEPPAVQAVIGEGPVAPEDAAAAVAAAPYAANWTADFDYLLVLNAGAIDAAALRPDAVDLLVASDIAALYRVKRAF